MKKFIAGAITAILLVAGSAATLAQADPNVETQLPADGVLSIERVGNLWTVTTDAVPTEVKVMSPFNSPICGVNYADSLGLCTTMTSFTADAACVYIQVDGIPGHVHSDPYVCRTGATTPPTEEPLVTEVWWALPSGGTESNITWPQTLASADSAKCGITYQIDTYPADAVPGLIADGVLNQGEDSAVVISWRFSFTPCSTTPPTTTTPTTTTPPTEEPPSTPPTSTSSPTPTVTTPPSTQTFRALDSSSPTPADQLAATGMREMFAVAGLAVVLAAIGLGSFMIARRRRS
jgi:hypothetical protein